MTDKELMQLALYALGLAKSSHNMVLSSDPPQSAWRYYDVDRKLQETITALDKRLAQSEQEPVAWMTITDYGDEDDIWYENPEGHLLEGWTYKPLYDTTPPQRQWVGLTDEEMRECAKAMDTEPLAGGWPELIKFVRAIEAAHGIKPQPEQDSNMTQTIGACIRCGNRMTGESCIACGNRITGAPESFVVATARVGVTAPEGCFPQQVEALHQQGGDKLSPTSRQPEQEHTGFMDSKINPIQRPWVGLTGEEVKEIIDKYTIDDHGFDIWCDGLGVVKAVDDKLRSKNT